MLLITTQRILPDLQVFFDVIIIDAPCSGSGLFRRDAEAVKEWSANNVALCSQRQQRIVADVFPALKEGGIIIYSTCSFSPQEDEGIGDWMVEEFGLQSLQLNVDPDWNIIESNTTKGNQGYRFWPYLVKGEGFFIWRLKRTQLKKMRRLK